MAAVEGMPAAGSPPGGGAGGGWRVDERKSV